MPEFSDKRRNDSASLSRYPAQLQQRTASLVNTAKRFRKLRALAAHQRAKQAKLGRQVSSLEEKCVEVERERNLIQAQLAERTAEVESLRNVERDLRAQLDKALRGR